MKPIRRMHIYKAAAVGVVVIASIVSTQVFAQPQILTNVNGMTVYTFDKDSVGRSACYGRCAAAWPPVPASNMPTKAEIAAAARADGIQQATYKGKPLYLFAGDRKPGDVNGDRLQNVWHVVPANGAASSASRQAGYGSTGSNTY